MIRFLTLFAVLAAAPVHADSLRTQLGTGDSIATFTLTDHSGEPFSPEQLRGRVWIAHFFFTTCTQGCDKTIARMKEIQDAVRGKRDIALVSISVNPNNDDQELLALFAKDLGAEPGQWFFLTGNEAAVHEVVQRSFFQSVMNEPNAPKDQRITHAFNLVVIDRDGKFAGYIDGRDPNNVAPLIDRVRSLARERYILPAINSGLNATAAILLVVGYLAIRARRETLHKAAMLSALLVSATFLTLYLYFHFAVLEGKPTRFAGPDSVRILYFGILLTHTILAAIVAPLAIYVTIQGLRDRRPRHVKVARWTLPIWLYVSITGVVVYWMLYHLYPPF